MALINSAKDDDSQQPANFSHKRKLNQRRRADARYPRPNVLRDQFVRLGQSLNKG